METQFGWTNVYNLMYKLDWYHTVSLNIPTSTVEIIRQNPVLFIRNYAIAFLSFAPGYLPPLAAALLVRDAKLRILCLAIALWTLVYFGLLTPVSSIRLLLIALPLSTLTVGLLIQRLRVSQARSTHRTLSIMALALCCGCAALFFIVKDYRNTAHRARERTMVAGVESYLRGAGCSKVGELFTTDFDLYFRSMPPYLPHFNGGAPRWGTYLFNQEYPELPVETETSFAAACRERGIRFALLTQRGALLSRALGELYQKGTSQDFVLRAEIGRFRIFEVTPRP
jgi:hypothetical protein